jgi:hypothetical protein
MSSKNVLSQEVSDEQIAESEAVVDETRVEQRASVEQEIQAKVDQNHPDTKGLTLEAEERMRAREEEIGRTRTRYDSRQDSNREERTRRRAKEGSEKRRETFQRRAASVEPWQAPDCEDPRETLEKETLADVNREANRLAKRLVGWSRAAVSRRLAERVADGTELWGATVGVFEELQTAPGQVIPIASLADVDRGEVSIRGEVKVLWESSSSKIAQVGLVEDESGVTKFTSWERSNQPAIREGEEVILRGVKTSWYEGRVSVAVTGWSEIQFPERERWWTE